MVLCLDPAEWNLVTTGLGVLGGGLITIFVTMLIESKRRPVLKLRIEDPPFQKPIEDADGIVKIRRNLRLVLSNESLPWGLRFMQRSAALQCRGQITFHHLNDGQPISNEPMEIRWASSPEHITSQVLTPDRKAVQGVIVDFARLATPSRVDVYPGEEEILDVAIRFDGETESYGWNNESYANRWRNPKWKLGRDRYLIRVVISSSGQKCVGKFRLVNDVDLLTDFRLTDILPEDATKLQAAQRPQVSISYPW